MSRGERAFAILVVTLFCVSVYTLVYLLMQPAGDGCSG